MSGQDNHHDKGGHELDVIHTGTISKVVFGLSGLVFLGCIGVAEWFYRQNAEIQQERAEQEVNYVLRQEVKALAAKETKDLDKVINSIVSAPEQLKAGPAPEGWVHPDDVKKQ